MSLRNGGVNQHRINTRVCHHWLSGLILSLVLLMATTSCEEDKGDSNDSVPEAATSTENTPYETYPPSREALLLKVGTFWTDRSNSAKARGSAEDATERAAIAAACKEITSSPAARRFWENAQSDWESVSFAEERYSRVASGRFTDESEYAREAHEEEFEEYQSSIYAFWHKGWEVEREALWADPSPWIVKYRKMLIPIISSNLKSLEESYERN